MLELGSHEIKTPAVCASIIGDRVESMKKNIEIAEKQNADIIELRLDKLDEDTDWKGLIPEDLPSIITNRPEWEGGYFGKTEDERIEILLEAIEVGADCIDIEISAGKGFKEKILERCRKNGVETIASFHDFDKVPPKNELLEKAKTIEKNGFDIAKIIGFARDSDASINILDFLIDSLEENNIPIVSFAMGDLGKFTRIAAPLLGSPFTYASVEEKAAPGQLDLLSIKKALDKFQT